MCLAAKYEMRWERWCKNALDINNGIVWRAQTGMGAPVDDRDFTAMIINSLSESFQTLLWSTTAAIRAINQAVTLDSIIMIAVVFEEADHWNLGKLQDNDDSALNASSNKGCHRRKKSYGRLEKKCSNCGQNGHLLADCWQKGGGKEG